MNKVDTIFLIHHSHTDVGYTHDQPIVWDLHGRFIDEAVRLASKYAETNTDSSFRWTVENTRVLYEWLKNSPAEQVKRFMELERAGRIEVTGMFANITPLMDADQLIETLQLVSKLREEYGFTITHAMNCDVNGQSWSLVDALLDMGIEAFTMAINIHFGGAPSKRPEVFWWQGPSGRKILAYAGWAYDAGWRFGIGRDEALLDEWWPRIQQRMEETQYPLPVLMVQSFHPFGDNGPAYEDFTKFIDEWNAKGKSPRLVFATPKMWWEAVKPYVAQLPIYHGDWTDFWNFGAISSAREAAINRSSRERLRTADGLAAALLGAETPLSTAHTARTMARYREDAWKYLHLWDEHTWGADLSIHAPESEDTASQWYHKAITAYQARSLSLMLQRDALADLSRYVTRGEQNDLLVFNPLPWERNISGEVPHHVYSPRGLPEDATSGRHSQDRVWPIDLWAEAARMKDGTLQEPRFGIRSTKVPGYGYKVIPRSELVELKADAWQEDTIIENDHHRLTFGTHQGGVIGWFDKMLGSEWFDPSAGYPLNGFVFEEVADHEASWPRRLMFQMNWGSQMVEPERGWKTTWRANRLQPIKLLTHRVYTTPFGKRVIQILEAPGINGPLMQSVLLPIDENYVEFESWWVMGQKTHPEATYVVFPFDIPDAIARIDLGGQAMIAGVDQIPGVCYDYYTAQQWVDISNDTKGITIALPENPMVQFGDFNFGKNQSGFHLERAMLLGWITNTYWETNFRAHQPGGVHARYRVYPHAGGFDPVKAHRSGMETAHTQPFLQHMGESVEKLVFPTSGEMLKLPECLDPSQPVFTLHIKPARIGSGLVLRLYNASDTPRQARICSGLLAIKTAQLCDLSENPIQALMVKNDEVAVELPSRQITTLRLGIAI